MRDTSSLVVAMRVRRPQHDEALAKRAGLRALLFGLRFGRFACTPLLLAIVADGWFTPAEATSAGDAHRVAPLAEAAMADLLRCLPALPLLLRDTSSGSTFAVSAFAPGLEPFGGRAASPG